MKKISALALLATCILSAGLIVGCDKEEIKDTLKDKAETYLLEQVIPMGESKANDTLQGFVSSGKITQAQADAIKAKYLEAKAAKLAELSAQVDSAIVIK